MKVGEFSPQSEPGAEDVVEATMRFVGGGIASASASRIGQRKVRSMVIHELDRMIEVDLLRRGVTAYRHTTIEGDAGHAGFRQMTEMEVPEIIGAEPLASQLVHFVGLVARRGGPRRRACLDPARPTGSSTRPSGRRGSAGVDRDERRACRRRRARPERPRGQVRRPRRCARARRG